MFECESKLFMLVFDVMVKMCLWVFISVWYFGFVVVIIFDGLMSRGYLVMLVF